MNREFAATGFNYDCGQSVSGLAPLAPDDRRPVWLQIADRIREAIAAGVFGQGERLPGTPPIARHYGVTRGTAHRAVRLLADEGVVRSVRPVGTFVRGVAGDAS